MVASFGCAYCSVWQSADNAVTAGYADKQLPIAQSNNKHELLLVAHREATTKTNGFIILYNFYIKCQVFLLERQIVV